MLLKEKKILGTVAYMGGVPAVLEEFCWSWGNLIAYNTEFLCKADCSIYYTKSTMSLHSYARNSIVNNMMGEWLFMLDTDHTFEPDILERMLNIMDTFNLPVLSGIYAAKKDYKSPIIYGYSHIDKKYHNIVTWPKESFLLQVDAAGGGCLLVKRGVFEKITQELNEEPFGIYNNYGEDMSFFHRLGKLNIPAYCCPLIEAQHLTIQPISIAERIIPSTLLTPLEQLQQTNRKDI